MVKTPTHEILNGNLLKMISCYQLQPHCHLKYESLKTSDINIISTNSTAWSTESHDRLGTQNTTRHYSDITWAWWHLKSQATGLFFFQKFFCAGSKQNIKPCITGPLWGESTSAWLTCWPGGTRHQSISSHGTDLVLPCYPGLSTRAPFQYRYSLSRCGDSQVKDKTVVGPSYLYNGNPYTGKTISLYWDDPLKSSY